MDSLWRVSSIDRRSQWKCFRIAHTSMTFSFHLGALPANRNLQNTLYCLNIMHLLNTLNSYAIKLHLASALMSVELDLWYMWLWRYFLRAWHLFLLFHYRLFIVSLSVDFWSHGVNVAQFQVVVICVTNPKTNLLTFEYVIMTCTSIEWQSIRICSVFGILCESICLCLHFSVQLAWFGIWCW